MGLFNAQETEFRVNTENRNTDFITNPDVAVANDGSFVVVWEEPFDDSASDIDIFFRRFSADGQPLDDVIGAETSIDSETDPAVAIAPNGNFVVTFVRNGDIFARIFNPDGFPAGNSFLVSTFQQDRPQSDPQIAIDGDGDFTIVWTHEFDENDRDIRGRFFSADGTAISDDIRIADSDSNETEASIAAIPNIDENNGPDELAVVITFTSDVNGNPEIFFGRYGNESNLIGDFVPVASEANASRNQRESSVAINADGVFSISWTNEFSDNDDDVLFRRFFPEGDAIDIEDIIVDNSLGDQNDSQIALDEDGTVVVVYEDDPNNNVLFRQFTNFGEPLTSSEIYDVNSDFETNPAVAIGGNNLVITADDNRTNQFDPYARVFDDTLLSINRFQNQDVQGTFLFAGAIESVNVRNNFSDLFNEEGFAFNVFAEPENDLIRINRFQNSQVPGTFLFASEEESVSIRANFPTFIEEGIAFYAYDSEAGIGEDYYRFQNSQIPGTYIFVDEQERNNIINNPNLSQFQLEGVAFEVVV